MKRSVTVTTTALAAALWAGWHPLSVCLVHAFVPAVVEWRPHTKVVTTTTNNYRASGVDASYGLAAKNSGEEWERDIELKSRQRATQKPNSGMGETAAGAVLGGLLLGPFGALFGASVGSSFGAKNALEKSRQEEMQKLGLSEDMLEMAKDIGLALEKSNEGLEVSQESLETQQRLARRYDFDAQSLYDRAQTAIQNQDEDAARKYLLERTQLQEKLKTTLLNCAQEKKRLEKLKENVSKLEQRAMEIDAVLRRSVSAKTLQDSDDLGDLGLSLQTDDPLLRKFKDLGID